MTTPSTEDPIEVFVNARQLTGPWTGTEVYMNHLMGALGRSGKVRISALTPAPLGLEIPNLTEIIPARRPRLPPGSLRATVWKVWFDQWRCLSAVAPKEGVLFHGMAGFLPYSLRRRDRAVATIHDLGWQAHPELFDRRLRLMYGTLVPWVLRRADRFIAVSRFTADDLMRRGDIPAAKIDVVYHGLDPVFTPQQSDPSLTSASPPYLLAFGGLSPARKNTRRIIAAFDRWRSRGGHRKPYQLRITGLTLERNFLQNGEVLPPGVSFVGYPAKDELPGLYARAAAFLYPGIYEGFGLPIIEAMACGAPVVTSRTAAAPEIAGGAAILVDPFDVESIVAGLEQVTTPEEARRLRSLGLQRAPLFDWNSAAAATVDVYRRLRS